MRSFPPLLPLPQENLLPPLTNFWVPPMHKGQSCKLFWGNLRHFFPLFSPLHEYRFLFVLVWFFFTFVTAGNGTVKKNTQNCWYHHWKCILSQDTGRSCCIEGHTSRSRSPGNPSCCQALYFMPKNQHLQHWASQYIVEWFVCLASLPP